MATQNLRIERRERQPAACIETTTSDVGAALQHALPAAFVWVGEHGGEVVGPPFTRYLEMGDGRFHIQAGVPTAAPMESSGEVAAIELPGGDVAVGDHYGPYETVAETAMALTQHAAERGREIAGPLWENYVTDPTTEPDPSKWLTEVCIPLA